LKCKSTNFQTIPNFKLSADKGSISHNFFGLRDEEQQDNELKFKIGQAKLSAEYPDSKINATQITVTS
jgi:hypothetical protein